MEHELSIHSEPVRGEGRYHWIECRPCAGTTTDYGTRCELIQGAKFATSGYQIGRVKWALARLEESREEQ